MARRELKDRVIYGHAAGDTASATSTSLSRPLKYKAWDESKMGQALSSVTKDGMSIREAALQFGVPKSTLGDRVSGRVLIGATSGPQTYLGRCEEEELVQFLLRCSEIGYAKSRKQVMALVRRVLLKKGKNAPVTSGWWESFCSRHPNLTLRAPAPLSKARAAASDPAILDRYFDLLQEVLVKNGLLSQACQIFNMDETGMPLDATHVKVVTQKGDRNPIAPSSGDKSQITVVACVNAAGSFMPPMVIIDRKTLPPHFTEGEVPGTAYGMSAKGWIDQELFDGWFTTHFLSYAPLVRPLLLLLDGHSSHYCPDTVRLAAKEKVIIFALPPNTTHITQPLDKGCFGPLKACWKEECHNFMSDNPGKVVNRYVFSQLLSRAWSKAMSIRNIAGGFKVCGIYPFNRDALRVPLKEQPKQMETLAKDSGLAYIPLFSPARLNGSHHPRSNSLESSDSSCSSPSSRSSSVRRHRSSSVRRHRSSSVRCGRPSSQYHQYSSVWHDHPSKRRHSSSVGRGFIPPPLSVIIPPLSVVVVVARLSIIVPHPFCVVIAPLSVIVPHPFSVVVGPLNVIIPHPFSVVVAPLSVIVPHPFAVVVPSPLSVILPPLSVIPPLSITVPHLFGMVVLPLNVSVPHRYIMVVPPLNDITPLFDVTLDMVMLPLDTNTPHLIIIIHQVIIPHLLIQHRFNLM